MLEIIINKFCNNSKFINDFDGVFQYLDEKNLSYEEKSKMLEEIFSYNSEMYSLLVEENKNLEKIVTRINITKERKELPIFEDNFNIDKEEVKPLEIDVSNYVIRIKECENLDQIKDLLSSRTVINTTIVLKLIEEMFDIKKMLFQDRHELDLETKRYFENESEKLKIKIEYIKQIINKDKSKIEVKEDSGNEMIFLKTNYGNVCAFSDLKNIPEDYYNNFYRLLESVRLGTFKSAKSILEIGDIKSLNELRDSDTRLIFDRIGKNTYVIISMFVKKVMNDAAYRASLSNRSELYMNNKEELISLALNNEAFLEENRQIKNKIYSILTKEDKVKKRGVINE